LYHSFFSRLNNIISVVSILVLVVNGYFIKIGD